MKKIIMLISLGLLLIGCSVTEHTASDGTSYTMVTSKWDDDFNKCKMDEYWYDQAEFNMPPVAAVADCYQQKQTYQLCNDWDFAYQNYYYNEKFVMLMRNSISEALIRKSEDPLKCRNPNNDAITKAKIEVDINILLNRVKVENKDELKRKIIFFSLIVFTISIFGIIISILR